MERFVNINRSKVSANSRARACEYMEYRVVRGVFNPRQFIIAVLFLLMPAAAAATTLWIFSSSQNGQKKIVFPQK